MDQICIYETMTFKNWQGAVNNVLQQGSNYTTTLLCMCTFISHGLQIHLHIRKNSLITVATFIERT